MNTRPKIIWLCTYSNDEKKTHLALWRNRHEEFGQWIPNLLQGFSNDARYELHVVSAEAWMRRRRESWSEGGVTYHCFQPGVPGVGYSFRTPVEAWTEFYFNRRHIEEIVKGVKPDLVHLFGVENPQYGAAVLDLAPTMPVLVTIQGFVHRQRQFNSDYITRVRCNYEEKLLRHCRHYSGDYDSEKVVRSINPAATWKHLYFPVNEQLVRSTPAQAQRYDILFAGGLTKPKGFGDFLEILRLLVQEVPHARAGVVGHAETYPDAVPFLKTHNLTQNLIWLGRFPSQVDLFRTYRQTKVFLTPTYNDAFASTVRECMLLGTPVVSYKTGGIPYANRDGNENVVIVRQGDIMGMAQQVLDLLRNEKRREALAARAMRFAQNEFSLASNVGAIKNEYERLIGQVQEQ